MSTTALGGASFHTVGAHGMGCAADFTKPALNSSRRTKEIGPNSNRDCIPPIIGRRHMPAAGPSTSQRRPFFYTSLLKHTLCGGWSVLVVDLSAVSDAGNAHALGGIVNDIHHTPVAHADAPLVFVPSELLRSRRAGIFGKHENLTVDPGKQRLVQRIQFLRGSGLYFERVFSHAGHCALGVWPGIPRRECPFACVATRKPGHPRSLPKSHGAS